MRLFLNVKKWIVTVLVATTALMALPNCFGGFVLTGKWHGFIKGISNKWLRWIVFLLTCIVYGIAIWVDAIIFNSIEFWSGSNPMAHGDFDSNGELSKTLEGKGEKVTFTYRNYGAELRIDMWKADEYKGNLVLLQSEPGQFYTERNGSLQLIQVSETEMPSSRLVQVHVGEEVVARRELALPEYYALREASERGMYNGDSSGMIARELSGNPAPAF